MKNAFDGLIRLDMARERVCDLEDTFLDTFQSKIERKNLKNRTSENCGTISKGVTCTMGTLDRQERENGARNI